MQILTAERIAALAAAANSAPSADNCHVIRLEPAGERLRVWPTEPFARSNGTRKALGWLSVGAVAENLMLRGAEMGVRLDPQWLPLAAAHAPLVEFTPHETEPDRGDRLATAIEHRHTNRRLHFRGPSLAPAVQQAMSAQAGSVPGTDLLWLDGPKRRSAALRLIRLAESERFRNPVLHEELFASIRFDLGWRDTAPEGLPPGSLELPWLERPAFALLRHWNVQRAANAIGAYRFVGWRAGDLPCRLAPHVCAVAASGPVDVAAINAGRLLQRVWLHATLLGLGFQVFAASAIYALDGSTAIGEDLRQRLAAGWTSLCPEGRPYIVFRMGYAGPPSVRADRPDASQLYLRAPSNGSGKRIVA